MIKKLQAKNIALALLLLAVLLYVIRGSTRKGDFMGYINAGHLTLNGENIYSDYLNTWPPFFSVFCVPLSVLDDWSSVLIRVIWLLLSVVAMFWSMRISIRWLFKKELKWPYQIDGENQISFTNFLVFIPFLILFRFLLDNLANIQINIFLLWAVLLTIDWFIKGYYKRAGVLLAFSISLKVYPIFLLLYFMFKREFSIVLWTILFLFVFNALPLVVYGYEEALGYYAHWWNEIASPYTSVQHKNQSFFSMLRSLFTHESPGLDIYLNIANLPLDVLKKVAYAILIIGALYPMYLFKNKLKNKAGILAILEYSFVLTAIPILTPLSWKAYFIFLWPAYLVIYYYLFQLKERQDLPYLKILKGLFFLSIILTVVSTDLFVGPWFSDVMEVFSSITIGTLLLMLMLLFLYNFEKKKSF